MKILLAVVQLVGILVSVTWASERVANRRSPPFGFTGVRGKKSIANLVPSDDNISWQQNLVGPQQPISWLEEKRLAPSGFVGMRGKKMFYHQNDKRERSSFLGMIGKKELGYVIDDQAPTSTEGFAGMPGKYKISKNFSDSSHDQHDSSAFFDIPSKKQPLRSSFFGMRGKKYPYEFRGKFVGVRGKKSSPADTDSWRDLSDLNGMLTLLADTDWDGRLKSLQQRHTF